VLPLQKLDEAKANYQVSVSTTKAAKATYDMTVNGARKEDKQLAQAMMDKAEGAVAEVEAYLKETELTAPISGEATSIVPKTGELITPGFPIITIVDLKDVWVTFNLQEKLLTKIKMGTVLEAKFPALGETKIPLKVNYINALGQYATWHATKASGDFDMKTFEIRAVPMTEVKGLRPGMTALVEWDLIKSD
jgi:HlyD family secretion protein